MNRRAFLTAAVATIPAVATGALPPTTPAKSVYDVKATVSESGVRLDFTSVPHDTRSGLLIGRAMSTGPDVYEAALELAELVRPEDPEAANWVLDVWYPQAIDGPLRHPYACKSCGCYEELRYGFCFECCDAADPDRHTLDFTRPR